MARRGGALLPPYETEDTLNRLTAAVDDVMGTDSLDTSLETKPLKTRGAEG